MLIVNAARDAILDNLHCDVTDMKGRTRADRARTFVPVLFFVYVSLVISDRPAVPILVSLSSVSVFSFFIS